MGTHWCKPPSPILRPEKVGRGLGRQRAPGTCLCHFIGNTLTGNVNGVVRGIRRRAAASECRSSAHDVLLRSASYTWGGEVILVIGQALLTNKIPTANVPSHTMVLPCIHVRGRCRRITKDHPPAVNVYSYYDVTIVYPASR